MNLYTGKGDTGTSTIIGDTERRSKGSIIFEVLGSVDELNAFLGMCKWNGTQSQERLGNTGPFIYEILQSVQENLFIIQAEIAGSKKTIKEDSVKEIEHMIGYIEKTLPPIRSFFIPGGSQLSTSLDYARALSRRIERIAVRAMDKNEIELGMWTIAYLNRLSSLLYSLVRYVNYVNSAEEIAPKY